MNSIDRIAGILLLISGALVLAFGLFSVLGTFVSALMAAIAVATGDEELLFAIPMVLIYGFWMVIATVGGALQLFGGVRLLRGQKDTWTWVAAIAALSGAMTVYCAPPGLIAFAFTLGAMVAVQPEEEGTGSARLAADRLKAEGPGEPFDPPSSVA